MVATAGRRARRVGAVVLGITVAVLAALFAPGARVDPAAPAAVQVDPAAAPTPLPPIAPIADPGGAGAAAVVESGPVEATGAHQTRADRIAAEEAEELEARANRQRLLFSTLSDLSAAADRADKAGNPEYAAALRHRAEVLTQGLAPE